MTDVFVIPLLLLGSALMLIAGIGVVRMPDLFTRMHVATKSSTLGVGCVLLGVAIFFGELGIVTRALLVSIFFLLTAPVAAHLLGRAGYIVGVALWEGTKWDELKGQYHGERDHTLDSPAPDQMKVRESGTDSTDQAASEPTGK